MNNLGECGSVVIWSGHTVDTLSHVDGDCACPLPRSRADDSEVRALPGGLDSTWWAAPVVEVPLDEAHIALVIATEHGGVAVLNQSAYGVWDQIRRHHRVLPGDPTHARLDVLAVIQQLWQAGLVLTAPYEPPAVSVSDVLQVWLHMTQGCNLRCSYCYLAPRVASMSAEVGQRAVETVFHTARQHGYQAVYLKYAGGEPLLNTPRVLAVHDDARAQAARHNLQLWGVVLTNGVLLDDAILAALAERDLMLMISLDGIGDVQDNSRPLANGRGSFARVERGIMLAKARGLTPHISISVTSTTAPALVQTVTWLLDRDLPFSINFYRSPTDTQAVARQASVPPSPRLVIEGLQATLAILEQRLPSSSMLAGLLDRINLAFPHPHPCSAGQDYLVIGTDGDIAACQMQIDTPLTHVGASDPLGVLRREWQRGSRHEQAGAPDSACSLCPWARWCASGCPLISLGNGDNVRSNAVRSPYCEVYQTMIPAIVRLEAKRLLAQAVQGR